MLAVMNGAGEKAVIVTGLIRNRELLRRCFAPFTTLLSRGLVDRVVYCTWAEEAAAHGDAVAELRADGVTIVTPPDPTAGMPPLDGGAFVSVYYQSAAIRAALEAAGGPDTLVLKARSDLVMRQGFAERLFADYDSRAQVAERFGFPGLDLEWPLPPLFKQRIWIPWVDLSLPFMMADECFMGRSADLDLLCGEAAFEPRERMRADAFKGLPVAHVYRYLPVFAAEFPVFRAYERLVQHFKTDMRYKQALLPVIFQDRFFWQIFALHAFAVRHYFIVDSGAHKDILWYTGQDNRERGWADIDSLKVSPYYEHPPEAWALDLDSFDANLGNYTLNCLDGAWLERIFTFQLPTSDLLKLFYTSLRDALAADPALVAAGADGLRLKLEHLAAAHPAA